MSSLTVAFDLDGTLVDTAPDLLLATNHVLGLVDLPAVELSDVRHSISSGARTMIIKGLEIGGMTLDDTDIDKLFRHFIAHYSNHIAVESRPYPGVLGSLGALAQTNTRLVVCTNKQEALSRKLLAALDMDQLFHAIVGRDTLPVCKPDPGHLIGAVILADGNPGNAIMVGDSETDIITSKEAGIPVIAVSFGYSDKPVAEYAPDTIIDDFAQLLPALQKLAAENGLLVS